MIPIGKPLIGDEEKKAVMDVLDSGMIASGSVVHAFENEFAEYIGAKACIATTSGTTALEVGLRALGIGPGDKVLTTPFSFIASTNSILYTGADAVFADIDPRTFNLSAEAVEKALQENPGIKALQIVHLFGQACNMDEIMPLVEKYHLILIEDCAQSHGAQWKGKAVGTFGSLGCFSFYPTKNMTTGEGGAVVTSDPELEKQCRLLINHGMEVRYYHDQIGYNYRMTNIAAAIGRCQLKKLDAFNQMRIQTAAYFSQNMRNPLITPPFVQDGAKHIFHQYTLKVADGRRDDFVRHLETRNIGYGVFYPLTIPEQKCYADRGFPARWQTADDVKQQVVSLPVHPALSQADKDAIVEAVNQFR